MYKLIRKKCKNCGKEYRGKPKSIYCSKLCSSKDSKTKFKKGLIPWNKDIKGKKSHSFGKKYALGNKLSEDTKRRIGLNGFHYGMLGKKASIETRKKQSKAHSGENNYNWQYGITSKNAKIRNGIEYRLWRESVFARDSWICQKYGTRGGKLRAHHIKNFSQYPELRFAIDNGITFSEEAHKEFHKIYSRQNNNKEQLKEFLNK